MSIDQINELFDAVLIKPQKVKADGKPRGLYYSLKRKAIVLQFNTIEMCCEPKRAAFAEFVRREKIETI